MSVRFYWAISGCLLTCISVTSGAEVTLIASPFGTTGGGELKWKNSFGSAWSLESLPTAGSVGDDSSIWTSFCLEYNEHIAIGSSYEATFTESALSGGVGGAVNGVDPLDPRTAFLVSRFESHSLLGYQYDGQSEAGISRSNAANALQVAIWWIEEEWALFSTGSLTPAEAALSRVFYDAAETAVRSNAWSGLGNVRVMHLQASDGGPAQDQVVVINVPAVVPLPPAGVAGVIALTATALQRRRRS